MYFDFNMKKLEVYKYILLHHSLDNRKKLIFDLFANLFYMLRTLLIFQWILLKLILNMWFKNVTCSNIELNNTFKFNISKQCWQQLRFCLHCGEPKPVAQKFPNNKTYKVQNIILNEKYLWKTNLFSLIKGLLIKQQYLKKTKGLFLTQNLLFHFTVHVFLI